MAIIPQVFINAVVSIGVRNTDRSVRWIATGFFLIRMISEDQGRPFLVTNRHVFNGKQSIVIRMKEKDVDTLKECDAPLVSEGKSLFHQHPNPKIDIAVLPLNAEFITNNHLEFPAFDIDKHALTSTELRNSGVDEGSLVFMLGFPLGLVNNNSGLPICRLGCIARMSETQIEEEYNILADIQNFPGNSGSPIILRPELMSIQGSKSLDKSVLVGIIHSYIPYKESLINSQTGETVEIRSENSGIANVHPVEFIKEIIDGICPLPNQKNNP